ncbi:ABC transporter permease subunit [Actinomadura sp. LD22]|uniref:ABC transporter permease subunit n=1 Tax=Actinomadura physcomitrii TaxID=2650748 RepID=A0A6I4MBW5_9ACTN|nr:ABC transporter permease subunit [Actinomadura physcomitrii]
MSFSDYLADRWPTIARQMAEHAEVVLIAVGIAAVIGIGLGIAVEGRPRLSRLALGVTGTMLTVPSLALFGLLIPLFGLGLAPTITALVLYAVFPILRNTITGLESVPGAVEEAARGMGLGRASRMLRIRLPLAWPVVLTGVRVATIMTWRAPTRRRRPRAWPASSPDAATGGRDCRRRTGSRCRSRRSRPSPRAPSTTPSARASRATSARSRRPTAGSRRSASPRSPTTRSSSPSTTPR